MLKKHNLTSAIVLSMGLLTTSTTQALTFSLTDVGGVGAGTQALAGFTAATDFWANAFTDPVTVNLDVGFSQLGAGVLGQTGSTTDVVSYNDISTQLGLDQTSADDTIAVANLQASAGGLSIVRNVDDGTNGTDPNNTFLDNDNTNVNNFLDVNTANLKALGINPNGTGTDAAITFNSDFNFDFDSSNGITTGFFDFVGIAIHEIGHALGFVSGVDTFDFFATPGATLGSGSLDQFAIGSVLDLYRFQDNSGNLDWTIGGNAFFSLDSGITDLAPFSTGRNFGDGQQTSHWKDSLGLGILDPTTAHGEILQVTQLDLQAFDVIGWDLNTSTNTSASVPVLSTAYLFGLGLIGLTLVRRRV